MNASENNIFRKEVRMEELFLILSSFENLIKSLAPVYLPIFVSVKLGTSLSILIIPFEKVKEVKSGKSRFSPGPNQIKQNSLWMKEGRYVGSLYRIVYNWLPTLKESTDWMLIVM